MEDIYDELDNYNEVNCIQELRQENLELKVKLEEHATAMEKLQKDYDTLAFEFKKLENNYSSLLKTARSEIERKTQRIAQLNTEKDIMVIHALQNGKPMKRHFNKGQNPNKKMQDANTYKGNKNVKEDVKLKNIEAIDKKERCDTMSPQVKNKETTANKSKLMIKSENSGAEQEAPFYRKSDAKEFTTQHKTEHIDTSKPHASSIKDRRKSTPATSLPIDKFSSDEEYEQNYPTKNTRTDIHPSAGYERRNVNRFSDRYSTKSETSSLDDRNSNYHDPSRNVHYHESSKDTYKGRSSRPYENNPYRGSDKYDGPTRYRKNYSPDRGTKRQHREFKDDYHRQDHGRHRILESPPREPVTRYHQRNEDSHSNSERHPHSYERPRYNEDKYAVKHKLSNNYDEPHNKRQKIESFNNPSTHFRENRKYYNELDWSDKQPLPKLSPPEYETQRASCQSPDYEHYDAALTYPIKEIMATAATPLEDPRVTSNRYQIKKENGKEILSIASGRNIDIQPVNKVEWKIPNNMPDALVRRPSLCSKGLEKDISNTVTNISIESGALCFESDENLVYNKDKALKNVANVHHNKNATEEISKQPTNTGSSTKAVSKYKIPKIQSHKNADPKTSVPVIDIGEQRSSRKVTDKIVSPGSSNKLPIESKPTVDHGNLVSSNNNTIDHDKLVSRNTNQVKNDGKIEYKNQVSLSDMAIVADDLELSDENSDNIDTHRLVIENVTKNSKDKSKFKESMTEDSKINVANECSSKSDKTQKSVVTVAIESVEDKEKESDGTKKLKSKKRKSKSKDGSSKDLVEGTDVKQVGEKTTRTKIEESKTKDTNNKFSDLFGDSSSLMTPEDLGIPSYLPIYEEDAVDMKIDDVVALPKPIRKITESCDDNLAKNNNDSKKTEPNVNERKTENAKTTKCIKNIESKEKEDQKDCSKIKNQEILLSEIYKNLNPGPDMNDSGVVQTIIISKGSQQLDDNTETLVEKPVTNVIVNDKQNLTTCDPIQSFSGLKRQDIIMKALATSTPQKDFSSLTSIGTDFSAPDLICNSNKVKSNDSVPQEDKQCDPITLDPQDAPDVRIFVKRRRKVVKRPPMT